MCQGVRGVLSGSVDATKPDNCPNSIRARNIDEYLLLKKYQAWRLCLKWMLLSMRRLKIAGLRLLRLNCARLLSVPVWMRVCRKEAFEKVEGKMNSKEKTEFFGSIIRTLPALCSLRSSSAKAVTPPMTPGMQSGKVTSQNCRFIHWLVLLYFQP